MLWLWSESFETFFAFSSCCCFYLSLSVRVSTKQYMHTYILVFGYIPKLKFSEFRTWSEVTWVTCVVVFARRHDNSVTKRYAGLSVFNLDRPWRFFCSASVLLENIFSFRNLFYFAVGGLFLLISFSHSWRHCVRGYVSSLPSINVSFLLLSVLMSWAAKGGIVSWA